MQYLSGNLRDLQLECLGALPIFLSRNSLFSLLCQTATYVIESYILTLV